MTQNEWKQLLRHFKEKNQTQYTKLRKSIIHLLSDYNKNNKYNNHCNVEILYKYNDIITIEKWYERYYNNVFGKNKY